MAGSTIFASFATVDDAERAAGALLDHGLEPEDVSLIARSEEDQLEFEEQEAQNVDDELDRVTGTSYGYPLITESGKQQIKMHDPVRAPEHIAYNADVVSLDDSDVTLRKQGDHYSPHDASAAHVPPEGRMDAPVEDQWRTRGTYRRVKSRRVERFDPGSGITTTTAADAGAGAVKGAAAGLGVGILAALAAVFIPGVGLVAGGGALATAMAGAAATAGAGAVAGGVTGWLKDQGVPDDALTVYRDTFDQGGALLAVNVPSDMPRAEIEAVLAKYNANNVDSYGQVTDI
jgi:hypothetical protein